MKNPAYPLELLMRIITVSLQTNQIVASLPALDIDQVDISLVLDLNTSIVKSVLHNIVFVGC